MNIFDSTSEIAIISILLKRPELINNVYIRPYMFSSQQNVNILSNLLELSSISQKPEYHLFINYLVVNNKIDSCGGIDYLNYLINQDFDETNLDNYQDIVIKAYKTRYTLSIVSDVQKRITTDSIDVILEDLKSSIGELDFNGKKETTLSINSICQSAWDILYDNVINGNSIKFKTGLNSLDIVTGGFSPGDLWVIAGRPGMGKTAMICNSALSGNKSLIFSLEMPKEMIVYRMLSILSGIPIFDLKLGAVDKNSLDKVKDHLKILASYPIFIDSNFNSDLNYLEKVIKKYRLEKEIEVVFVDYLQLLSKREMDATHELGRITRSMKLLANSLGITIVLCSQLNRGLESREDKRPVLSDLRQSGNIEEDADVVIFLHRDFVYNRKPDRRNFMELIIGKQRNGPIGMIPIKFNELTGKMEDEIGEQTKEKRH